MKGVVLAGGKGTRLHPLTRITNKHLLPIYDRPMVTYAIEALVQASVGDIMLVTGGTHAGEFFRLFGNGHDHGVDRLLYAYQEEEGGIADALSLAERFIESDHCVVVLADNIFERSIAPYVEAFRHQEHGARLLLAREADPEHLRHLGVPELDGESRISRILEKPQDPPSAFAVTGVYFYDAAVWEFLPTLEPSGPRRAGDLRRQQLVRRAGRDLLRRGRGLLGRRRRVDRRLLRRQRLRARERGEQAVIEGLVRVPLQRFEDERGWLMELRRESKLPKPTRQTNLSFSRQGVIRGLHYHERGQDDLFACLKGMARVVVLDRTTGETFCEDIGDENPVAVYIPGYHAHGFEALTDLLFCYHVTEEYDPADPDEHGIPWDDPRVRELWSTQSPILSERRRVLITGAGGQLGHALAEVFPQADARTRAELDVTRPLERVGYDLVLHCAAWTDVDGAEADEEGALAVNAAGTRNVVALGAPVVYYSSDYVFDGRAVRAVRGVRRAEPRLRLRPHEVGGRARGRRGLDRAVVLALRADGSQLRAHDARARPRARRGLCRRRPARLPDLRRSSGGGDTSDRSSCPMASTT